MERWMKRGFLLFLLFAWAAAPLERVAQAGPEGRGSAAPRPMTPVVVLSVQGPVVPILATYLDRGLGEAEREHAICVITLDTPGGLVATMQVIVQRMLEARIPVVVYVSPEGAWAGSAGVFITYAAHVTAMAPGTNIGAAHPVSLVPSGGEATRPKEGGRDYVAEKSENHLASYARSLAQRRGRNEKWAEEAVRRSVSLTASEAVKQHVVDLESANLADLLQKLEGRRVTVAGQEMVLHPDPTAPRRIPMTWAEAFVFTISSPGLAALLMMLGTMGLIYEFTQPGAVLPGVVGVLCLLLGLYAMGQLPINYAGLALMLFSVVLFVADLKLATHGALTLGGVVSMVLGAVLLVPSAHPWFAISGATIGAMVIMVGGGFFFLALVVASSLRRQSITGASALVGTVGRAMTDLDPEGSVQVGGEIWKARVAGDALRQGAAVKVRAVEDFTLLVEAAAGWAPSETAR